jgi:hypothetical protein
MPGLDPVVLFFLLGLAAGLARSGLRIPEAVYEGLSIYLLLSIGLKGGVELATSASWGLALQLVFIVALGVALPLIAYPVLRQIGRLGRADAASIAAHYGSVSVVTFAVATAYLARLGVGAEGHLAVFLVVLEVPAILVGIALARRTGGPVPSGLRGLLHEVLLGKGVVLLLGGLGIGWYAGPEGVEPLAPLFFDLFKPALALFLLEMGLVTAARFADVRRSGPFLLAFGVGMPLFSALLGGALGLALGLSVGGTALLATLAASASYIAAPAAMRIAVPAANPALSLAASLGVTFPFNVLLGIPLYYRLALLLHGAGG